MEGEVKLGRGGAVGKKWCYQRQHGLGLTCLCIVVWQWHGGLLSVCDCDVLDIYLWPGSVSSCPGAHITTRPHHPLSKVTVCPGSQRSLAYLHIVCSFITACCSCQLFCPIFRRFSKKTVWPVLIMAWNRYAGVSAALLSVLVCSSCRVWGPTIKNRGPF